VAGPFPFLLGFGLLASLSHSFHNLVHDSALLKKVIGSKRYTRVRGAIGVPKRTKKTGAALGNAALDRRFVTSKKRRCIAARQIVCPHLPRAKEDKRGRPLSCSCCQEGSPCLTLPMVWCLPRLVAPLLFWIPPAWEMFRSRPLQNGVGPHEN
jgi:hypothetical protein